MIWERKFEVDSLAAVLKLISEYYFTTKDTSFMGDAFLLAIENILNTF